MTKSDVVKQLNELGFTFISPAGSRPDVPTNRMVAHEGQGSGVVRFLLNNKNEFMFGYSNHKKRFFHRTCGQFHWLNDSIDSVSNMIALYR